MNQYRHSKSSLFLMEIILNILFFSILATFCVQIFFKGYQLSKSTEKLHQAVTACTSIAEICQSTDSPEETLSSIYPESMSLNETILIYYNKDFLACGKQNAVYRATVDFLPDQLATIHITFLDTSTAETVGGASIPMSIPIPTLAREPSRIPARPPMVLVTAASMTNCWRITRFRSCRSA